MLVVGEREAENQKVAVSTRDGKDLGAMAIEEFATILQQDIAKKGRLE
jgi:threonyl-tRNA synthetase